MRIPASSSLPKRYCLRLSHSHEFNNFIIECDDIDGVVFGSWTNVNENPSVPAVEEDNAYAGYWVAAAVWFSFYDQKSIDRVSHISMFFFASYCHIKVLKLGL